jgi:hypothetical protein
MKKIRKNLVTLSLLTLINVAPFQGLRRMAPYSKWPCLKKKFEKVKVRE